MALDPLVVGVDGSDMSSVALRWAAARAAAPLLVVHGERKESARAEAGQGLAGPWVGELGDTGRVETHLVDDDPADALAAVARDRQAMAIVVGAHGSGHNQHSLGRVTRRLLRHADVPVIVVKSDDSIDSGGDRPVLACVGYGDASAEAALWAAGYAAAVGHPLVLMHAVGHRPMVPFDKPAQTLASYLGSDVAVDWAQTDLDDLRDQIVAAHPGLSVETDVDRGSAIKSIEAASVETELVVLGKRHSGRLVRSVISPRIQQTVIRADAPVAVVPSCQTGG